MINSVRLTSIPIMFNLINNGKVIFTASNSSNSNPIQPGWLMLWCLLIILIVIITIWIFTWVFMHRIIQRLRAELETLRSNNDSEVNRARYNKQLEYERTRQSDRASRRPKGNCTVCNHPHDPGSDAFRCKCKTFIHLHCLQELILCPKCGANVSEVGGIIRSDERAEVDLRATSMHRKVNRLLTAKLCSYCNKIIRAGEPAIQCNNCRALYHEKCNVQLKLCIKCEK